MPNHYKGRNYKIKQEVQTHTNIKKNKKKCKIPQQVPQEPQPNHQNKQKQVNYQSPIELTDSSKLKLGSTKESTQTPLLKMLSLTPKSLKFEEKSDLERRKYQERVETQRWICKNLYRSANCRNGFWNNTQLNPPPTPLFSKNANAILWINTEVNPKKPFFSNNKKAPRLN